MSDDRAFAWPEESEAHYASTPNPSSSPKACGLEILDELDDPNANYSFHTIIAFRDLKTHAVYLAADSGCSCPRPFEDVKSLADMTRINHVDDARAYVNNAQPSYAEAEPTWPLRDVFRFLARIDVALSEQ